MEEESTWRGKVGGMSEHEREDFLARGKAMRLACLKPDGSPYIAVCWHEANVFDSTITVAAKVQAIRCYPNTLCGVRQHSLSLGNIRCPLSPSYRVSQWR